MSPVGLMLLAALAGGAALLELARLPLASARRVRRVRPEVAGRARWAADERAGPHEALLDAAGRGAVPDAEALLVRRRTSAVVGASWCAAACWLLQVAPPVLALAAAAGAAGGWWLPLRALRGSARRRREALREEAPELLDLRAVALGCGLPLRDALATAGGWAGGTLGAGVRRTGEELARGAGVVPALDRLTREHPIEAIESAVAIMLRARDHGTAPAPALRALADGARHARARRAVEQAARAAPKIQLVAALLLVPAALCVLAAAVVTGAL